jgi:hypothetical protein
MRAATVLIASVTASLLWLLGTAVQCCGLHQRLHPGNGKRRGYSRVFLACLLLLLVLESSRERLAEVLTRPRSTRAISHE